MATLECRDSVLYVVEEAGESHEAKRWLPVRRADYSEARMLGGRAVSKVDASESAYVDEEGNVYRLMDKGETKPIEGERLSGGQKSELEVLLKASLNGRNANGRTGGETRRLLKKDRRSGRKQQALQMVTAKPEARPAAALLSVETNVSTMFSSRRSMREARGEQTRERYWARRGGLSPVQPIITRTAMR
jgi:hypothetical protein